MQNKRSGEAAILFKPRQVLLNSLSKMKHEIQTKTPVSLSTQQRTLLLQSICQFLELNGFSKTLKNFRKEVDFEKESWKNCLLNLEEMCYHYLNLRNDAKVDDNGINEQDRKADNTTKDNEGGEGKEPEAKAENHSVDLKKKKKKSKKATELSEETIEENPVVVSVSVPSEPEKKSKNKKKKHTDDSQDEKSDGFLVKPEELPAKETSEKLDVVSQEEKKVKSKSKKKKGDTVEPAEVDTEKKSSDLLTEETSEKLDAVSQEEKKKSKSKKRNEDTVEPAEVDTEKKISKKRKKSSSEENNTGCVENATLDDSKRRKIDNLDLDQSNETTHPKTPNGSANGVLEDDGNQDSQKGKKWQQNGSTEPRSAANAFRRVREEEVEFVDEKLQDNSYWAKDGADSGYGAKAQEVLGQVRGRDFRHEKTKKKRGSYRGGQIDLHSHSFKFNYDDEE